ncbi:hypothetical protein AMTR_s00055p00016190 [Amborella trichopoda]|uniref:Uncharacterized protein n=1 Tax=Amborella trichopoda TaxID=13333 RepID=U5D9W3_AMBTC|nr:hypothetical protein AMTR_s00055p00016190 [Amborella trichopoda]
MNSSANSEGSTAKDGGVQANIETSERVVMPATRGATLRKWWHKLETCKPDIKPRNAAGKVRYYPDERDKNTDATTNNAAPSYAQIAGKLRPWNVMESDNDYPSARSTNIGVMTSNVTLSLAQTVSKCQTLECGGK